MRYLPLSFYLLLLIGCEAGRGGITDMAMPDLAQAENENPLSCAEAAANGSYIGCDYWPTVTANSTFSTYNFAVVVANLSETQAVEVTITGPGNTAIHQTIAANSLEKIKLPWVAKLKGNDQVCKTNGPGNFSYGADQAFSTSVKAANSAYHLVSTLPVVVYQFNPLEYQGLGCPACGDIACYSFTNDASLLIPSTAMTPNYLLASVPSKFERSLVAITAVSAGTTQVTVKLTGHAQIEAGDGISATAAGASNTFSLNQGDVVELVGPATVADTQTPTDFTGSIIRADKPVQVIGGIASSSVTVPAQPTDPKPCCADHMEETTMPAETLGKKYVVTVPSSPNKTGAPLPVPAHMVRWVGNVNDTHLAYDPPIAGAPATLQAGEVVTLPQVDTNFQVTGDQPFLVQTVMLEADVIDAASSAASRKGDPSLSFAVATEQYRKKYLFLAPDDYAVNYVDVVKPTSAILTLDGKPVTATAVPIGTSGFGLVRIRLSSNAGGVHVLNADQQIGIQVLGYGEKTSYQYPGGINLRQISPVIM